uniref:40S ribosomal protein S19-binding protein 1 n=1 Tax=Loa loa TaxID=7209 RepID=A0A1I7VCC8_LOALO
MSMKLLKEAIELVNADDSVKSAKTVRKSGRPSKMERNRQQFAAANVKNQNRKNIAKNISLLEESRLKGKTNLLKRNIKYMIYEANCKLDPDKTKQMMDFMDEHNRRRKKILRALRKRNNGVRDHRYFKKSNNKSIFTNEDFMKVGPDRIKLLRRKNVKKSNGQSKE